MVAHGFADSFFGPAQRSHGATYTEEFEVGSASLGAHPMVMDMGALRALARQALAGIAKARAGAQRPIP
jgi:6-pyruvoyl-tetrahydropterin synthase